MKFQIFNEDPEKVSIFLTNVFFKKWLKFELIW